MLTKEQTSTLEQPKRVMLIIFGALLVGVVVFAIIAVISRISGGEALFNMEFGLLAVMGVGFAALVLIPSFVVPIITRKTATKELGQEFAGQLDQPGAAMKSMEGLQTSMIIGLALLEGTAFFNLIGYMIDGSAWNLLTVAILLMIMFIRIPLPGRVDDWVADMLDEAKR